MRYPLIRICFLAALGSLWVLFSSCNGNENELDLIPPTVYIEYGKEKSGNVITRYVNFIATTNYGLDSVLLYAHNQDTILYYRRQGLSEYYRKPGSIHYGPVIELDNWNILFSDKSKYSDSIQIIGTIIDINGLSASDTVYVTIGEF